MVGGVPTELGFLPLYSFSDFRHPLLGFHHIGPPGRVRPPIGLFSGLICAWKFVTTLYYFDFYLTLSSGIKLTISIKSSQADIRKVPIRVQQGFLLYS